MGNDPVREMEMLLLLWRILCRYSRFFSSELFLARKKTPPWGKGGRERSLEKLENKNRKTDLHTSDMISKMKNNIVKSDNCVNILKKGRILPLAKP